MSNKYYEWPKPAYDDESMVIWREGNAARAKGKGPLDNPEEDGTAAYEWWLAGVLGKELY